MKPTLARWLIFWGELINLRFGGLEAGSSISLTRHRRAKTFIGTYSGAVGRFALGQLS